ncbi:MAG: hypothetical protein JRI25_06720 [Deltaproteobacteria bacterium]|nr:hypothetical protein [Deltaproteobacteria bacterium]
MRYTLLALGTLLCAACRGGDDSDAYTPDLACPGDASGVCDLVEDAPLRAGAAVVSIVPECYETWQDSNGDHQWTGTEPIHDCGCDRLCPGDEGYPGPDEGEDDDQFQAQWLAGGGHSIPVNGVRDASMGLRGEGDGLWARALVLEQGNTTVAIVAFDLIGLFYDDTLRIRDLATTRGLDLDHLVVHATHVHAGPDTMGIWGPNITQTGYDPRYVEQVRSAAVDAIEQALDGLTEVTLTLGEVDAAAYSPEKGVFNVNSDTRDPWIIRNELRAARFADASGDTVATLVNWASHPETLLGSNALMTSGFVHALRATVEEGVTWDTYSRSGVGGPCIYINGALGGMMTTLRVDPIDPDGNEWTEKSFEAVDVIGQLLGEMALDAIEEGESSAAPQLSFQVEKFEVPIENHGLQAMSLLGVIDRATTRWDPEQPIDDDNLPWVVTEIDVLTVGSMQWLTIPGEPLPELIIGGYDGSRVNAPGKELVSSDNPNPPDLEAAPTGPYLADLMTAEHKWIVGLGNDELGYIIPAYDFELHSGVPYVLPAEGHYEETNSLGPDMADRIEKVAAALLQWTP